MGGNNVLFIQPGGKLSFPSLEPQVVLMDIQGMGDNPYILEVMDNAGFKKQISGQGILFGVNGLGLTSPNGIDTIELLEVGGTGGPMVLSRILFSPIPEPSSFLLALTGVAALFLMKKVKPF